MHDHHNAPPALAGLIAILETVTPEEAAILAGLATSAVPQALALRSLSRPAETDEPQAYTPHPLDVLIFAAIEQDGAMQQAELLAALANDSYKSQGKARTVSAGTLNARLPELVECRVLTKTAAGYAINDKEAASLADATFND